jgi:hypothetical protein
VEDRGDDLAQRRHVARRRLVRRRIGAPPERAVDRRGIGEPRGGQSSCPARARGTSL